MAKFFFSILFLASVVFWGLLGGSFFIGRWLVPAGSGLAGGAIVLGYGVATALVCALVGAIACYKISFSTVRRIAIASLPISLVIGALLWVNAVEREQARKDPDSEYAGISEFEIDLEQLVIKDPYLRTEMHVSSKDRAWKSRLPDKRTCQGIVRASILQKINKQLQDYFKQIDEIKKSCQETQGVPELRFSWRGEKKGELFITEQCLNSNVTLSTMVRLTWNAANSQTSGVKCF